MANYDAALKQWGNLVTETFDDNSKFALGEWLLDSLSKYAPKVAQVFRSCLLFRNKIHSIFRYKFIFTTFLNVLYEKFNYKF